MIFREKLENNQVWLYIVVVILAAGVGLLLPEFGTKLDVTISIIIAALMYSMFSQIPFTSLKKSFANRRFIFALLLVNYIAVPIVVWFLTRLLPDYPPLLLGVFLVLLTPCIDYVIVFTALGRGNEKLMLISTPILLLTQLLLLPLYLVIFIGKDAAKIVEIGPFLEAFIMLIVIPLVISVTIQVLMKKSSVANKIIDASAWLPVPFMAMTLFVIIASQINKLPMYINDILKVIPIYILFIVIMPFISKFIANCFKLDIRSGRALIFSGSTRNSLVVLPLALALPEPINTLVAAIIVTQTLIEIVGEIIYIRLVPHIILRD